MIHGLTQTCNRINCRQTKVNLIQNRLFAWFQRGMFIITVDYFTSIASGTNAQVSEGNIVTRSQPVTLQSSGKPDR